MSWELLLGAWGAGLSTALLLREWWQSRARLDVRVAIEDVEDPRHPNAAGQDALRIDVTNVGVVARTVIAAGIEMEGSPYLPHVGRDRSVLLAAGEHEMFGEYLDELYERIGDSIDPVRLQFAWVRDSTGRMYRTKPYPLRKR